MPINLPKKLVFRFGEMQEGNGYSIDKPDSSVPGAWLVANPVSLLEYEESLPDSSERETLPGISGSAFKEVNVPVRGPRTVRMRTAVHPGRDDPKNIDFIGGREALDELQYWMFGNLRENKFHTWDTRFLKCYVANHRWKFIPGMNLDNMDLETELLCADPFHYSETEEYGAHTWDSSPTGSTEVWSGGTTGRVAGDEVAYASFSMTHKGPNNTPLQTGFRLTHTLTGRSLEWYGTLNRGYQFFLDMGSLRASLWEIGEPNWTAARETVRGVPLWLVPDGQDNEFTLEPIWPNNTKPADSEIDVQYAWRPRFQI